MSQDTDLIDLIGRQLQEAQSVLIASHIRPDGDAVGSLLGLGLALQAAGKRVQLILSDGVPSSFKHLPGADAIQYRAKENADLTIALDAADLKRLGKAFGAHPQIDICIDHHISNERFARLNLVEADMPATAAVLARYLPQWGFEITPQVAAALLTGILTDTIGFRTPNVRPDLLRLVADLMEKGANLHALYYRALVTRRFNAMRYWGQGLTKLEKDGDLVWATLTLADRQAADYPGNDDADLINTIAAIDGFKVAMIFVEQPGGRFKISWRTADPSINVSQVASYFGGGGHAAAAGAEVDGTLQDKQSLVIQKTREMLQLA